MDKKCEIWPQFAFELLYLNLKEIWERRWLFCVLPKFGVVCSNQFWKLLVHWGHTKSGVLSAFSCFIGYTLLHINVTHSMLW